MGVKEGSGVGEYNPAIDHVTNGEEASEVVFRRPSINLENRTEALKEFVNSEEIRVNLRFSEHEGEIDENTSRIEVIEPLLSEHTDILNVIEPIALSALQPFPVVTAIADFTAETDKVYVVAPVLPTMSIQLPPPADATVITIKDISGFANGEIITIVRNGTELIDTLAEDYIMTTAFGSVTLVSNGVDWFLTSLGGGTGGAGGPSFLQDLKFQLKDSSHQYLFWSVFSSDKDDKIESSDGAYNNPDEAWGMDAGNYFQSVTALKPNFLSLETLLAEADLTVKYKDVDNLDPAAVYELIIGGTTLQTINMERVGTSDTFTGHLDFDRSLINELILSEYQVSNADAQIVLNATTQQKVSQEFTALATNDVYTKFTSFLTKTGNPIGSYKIKLVKDNAGDPSEDYADLLWDSGYKDISLLASGDSATVFGLANNLLTQNVKYHIVFETDAVYQGSGYNAGIDEIGVRSDNSAPSIAVSKIYDGASYSASTDASVFKLEGYLNELKVKVTASTTCLVDGFGVFFGTSEDLRSNSGYPSQLFTVIGNIGQTVFPITNFTINPEIIVVENNYTGQTWSFPAFSVDASNNSVIVPNEWFEIDDEVFAVKIYHHSSGAVDNSDTNALDLAEAHIGRFKASGRGVPMQLENSTVVTEIFLDENGMISFRTV